MNIDFPLRFDGRGRTGDVSDDDHIRDMIEQVLLTAPGERVNRPTFGSGAQLLVFAPNSDTLASAMRMSIQAGLQTWLGDLIETVALDVASEEAVLTVDLKYLVRRTGEIRQETFVQGAAS